MIEQIHIESVPPAKYPQAVTLVCGQGQDFESQSRAQMLLELIRARAKNSVQFYWALQQGRPVAASLVLASPGKAGMIFYTSPLEASIDVIAAVTDRTARASMAAGLTFVQALVEVPNPAEVEILQRAGLSLLAELIYMRRELAMRDLEHTPAEDQYTWRQFGDFDDDELAAVIAKTYEKSLDCPALAGVREMRDVIATHRSCGVFTPESWWLVEQAGQPAGCILVNDYPTSGVSDVVYLGVTVPFRGRGISRLMLHRTGRGAMERGYGAMTLAVDAANPYALRVYQQEGFIETTRRSAYALLAGKTVL